MGSGISREVLPERLDEESFMAVSKIMLLDIFHKKKDKDGYLTKSLVLDFLKALSLFTTGDFPPTNFDSAIQKDSSIHLVSKVLPTKTTKEEIPANIAPKIENKPASSSKSFSSGTKEVYYSEEKMVLNSSKTTNQAKVDVEKNFKIIELQAVEKPKSPRLNNLFPDEKNVSTIATVPNIKVSSPVKTPSHGKKKSIKEIRFIDFDLFCLHGSMPRFPDQRKLTVPFERIDRSTSIIIFISYSWLSKTSSGSDPSHPDNANSDLYNLCVEGIAKTYKSFAPDMKKCYLWIDYSCLNQDLDLIEEMTRLDKIVECCDCVFTPLYTSNKTDQPQQQLQNTLNSKEEETDKSNSKTLQEDSFARELCIVSRTEATEYMSNAWCRLHMLYAATIPLLSTSSASNKNIRSSVEFASYYIDFENDDDEDNQRLARFSVGLKVHGMCGRRPHIVYSNSNSNASERVPKILPLFHFLFYENYDPEQGHMVNATLELPVLKQLVLDLAPHIVFPTLGYDGEYDSEDGSVNGQGRYVYEDGSMYTGAFNNGRKHGQGYLIYSNGCMYAGSYKDDRMHGFGIYKYASGDVYAGKYTDDKKNGPGGFYFYANGDVYEGMLQDGKMNGRGLFRYTNGDVYEGEFRNDLKDGVGRFVYHTGAVFEGGYVQDRRCGKGVYVYSTGDIYDGDWKDGVMCGEGEFRYKNGDVYRGCFRNDKKHGSGVFTYRNGDVYEGDYADNKKNGIGVYRYISGVVYEGEFKDNKKHGKGSIVYVGGDQYSGDWKEGKRSGKGVMIRTNGDRYEGEFAKDAKNGHGKITYAASGDVFEGSFVNDKKHGVGVYRYAHNGYTYEGKWKEGNTVSEMD